MINLCCKVCAKDAVKITQAIEAERIISDRLGEALKKFDNGCDKSDMVSVGLSCINTPYENQKKYICNGCSVKIALSELRKARGK